MLRHRKLLILSVFLIVATAVGLVVYQRIARPARAVLLLPDGNFLLYVNFSPAHYLDLGQLPAQSDPQYQDFLQQTGFHFEHDLDTIAVSQRNPGDFNSESSAIFVGSFDQGRLNAYLQKLSSGTEAYAGKTIFSIRQEGHTVRACMVDAKTVAVTNMESAEPIHSIIDKARGSYLASTSSSLMQNYYGYVPFGSLAWAMLRLPSQPGGAQLPGGMNMDFLQNSVSVISVRYTGSIRVKAEVISANAADAARVLQAANMLLALGQSAKESLSPAGADKDVKAVFDSIQVQQNGNRTAVTVTIPQDFVKKMAEKIQH
jgi:hypothetical protein